MKPTHLAGLALALFVHDAARAAEWSYCVAPAQAEQRIYVSAPFQAPRVRAEGEFEKALAERGLPHDVVECARADDEASAVIMRQHAVDVNRQWGRQVTNMPWRPLR